MYKVITHQILVILKHLLLPSRMALGPTQPPIEWVLVILGGNVAAARH